MSDVKNKKDLTEFLQKLSLFSYETLRDFKKYTSKGYVSNTTNLKDFIFEVSKIRLIKSNKKILFIFS